MGLNIDVFFGFQQIPCFAWYISLYSVENGQLVTVGPSPFYLPVQNSVRATVSNSDLPVMFYGAVEKWFVIIFGPNILFWPWNALITPSII
jgi:hypothetical protein